MRFTAKTIDNKTQYYDNEKPIEDILKTINNLHKENETLKLSCAKCGQCKHADLYVPSFGFPFVEPRCSITKKSIKHDDGACRDFELVGRMGR